MRKVLGEISSNVRLEDDDSSDDEGKGPCPYMSRSPAQIALAEEHSRRK